MQKRLDEEVRIFPNDESALPLIGALLAEQNKVWQEKHYLDMSECVERPPPLRHRPRGQQACCSLRPTPRNRQPNRKLFTAEFGVD